MAKKLGATGIEPTEAAAVLRFERLGELFECRVALGGLSSIISMVLRAMRTHQTGLETTVERLGFATSSAEGRPPTLRVDTPDGVIGLALSWEQVAELSRSAAVMLAAQKPGRRN